MSQAPKLPPLFPASLHVVYVVFTWFSNGTTDPKQKIKQPKTKFATPKLGEGNELGPASLVLLCQPFTKTNNEPEHQQTKQKHKKQKTHSHTHKTKNMK